MDRGWDAGSFAIGWGKGVGIMGKGEGRDGANGCMVLRISLVHYVQQCVQQG